MRFLLKESYHTGDNHGAIYEISEEFDEEGKPVQVEKFMGNVVCPDLDLYLAENPDIVVKYKIIFVPA